MCVITVRDFGFPSYNVHEKTTALLEVRCLILHIICFTAAARMVSYEKQRSKTFYTSNRREEDKLCYEKAVDSINIAKEV